jgi:hypothetical protein
MSRLLAISDLHLNYEVNRQALLELLPRPGDWLILAGDVGDSPEHLEFALATLAPRFRQVVWVPGNHDLWTIPGSTHGLRGVELYEHQVELCRSYGALTPEDPFATWDGLGQSCVIAPLFLLYDYSFRPDDVPLECALEWAADSGVMGADEGFLHPDPYPSRSAWCEARCRQTEERLARLPHGLPVVLVNHFPLRRDLVRVPIAPRFSLWCGTRRTEDWHTRYHALAVVSGHLHVRATDWRDGVRFEECSLGYPRQWQAERGLAAYLREILPGPRLPGTPPL